MPDCQPLAGPVYVDPETKILRNNSTLQASTNALTPGTKVTLSCIDGYTLHADNNVATCKISGLWDFEIPPTCEPGTGFDSLPAEQKIIIAVAVGAGGLIFIILVCMLIAMYRIHSRPPSKSKLKNNNQGDRTGETTGETEGSTSSRTNDRQLTQGYRNPNKVNIGRSEYPDVDHLDHHKYPDVGHLDDHKSPDDIFRLESVRHYRWAPPVFSASIPGGLGGINDQRPIYTSSPQPRRYYENPTYRVDEHGRKDTPDERMASYDYNPGIKRLYTVYTPGSPRQDHSPRVYVSRDGHSRPHRDDNGRGSYVNAIRYYENTLGRPTPHDDIYRLRRDRLGEYAKYPFLRKSFSSGTVNLHGRGGDPTRHHPGNFDRLLT